MIMDVTFEESQQELDANFGEVQVVEVPNDNPSDAPSDSVRYTAQDLTPEQQAQARANIGAASLDDIPEVPENTGGIPIDTAEVGQTIVVKAVDESGKPTEWEATDLPSGEKPWKLVAEGTLTEDVQNFVVSKDSDGKSFQITEYLRIEAVIRTPDSATSNANLRVFFNGDFNLECWDFISGLFKGTPIPISLLREYLDSWTLPEAVGRRFGSVTDVKNGSPNGTAPKVIKSITFFGANNAIIGAGTKYRIYTK